MSTASAASSSLPVRSTQLTNSVQNQEEEDAFECLELPPPMKPISKIDDNCIQSSNQSSGSKALDENDLAEIEQIVKEKMVSGLLWPKKKLKFTKIIFFFVYFSRRNTKQV